MFEGFTKEAFDFLFGIRMNNNKEWFEPRKKIYTEYIYNPLKALTEEIYKPFSESGMISKTGRIYRDESYPPYLHYRDTLWIYIRYNAWDWSKTPTLYFEISPEGGEFGFRISKPAAAVMEKFRSEISENPQYFLELVDMLKKNGIEIGGEEYKRKKKCTILEAEELFVKKGLSAYRKITDLSALNRPELIDEIVEVFRLVMPLNDYFHRVVNEVEAEKLMAKLEAIEDEKSAETDVIKAPGVEFMW
ncbi:MAG: DUF2461 family protein [Ruminococcus sp.]|nr:DUF2461 family protein [Ruminococcus sp.]